MELNFKTQRSTIVWA